MHQQAINWDDDVRNPWSSTRVAKPHPYRDWLKAVFCWDGVLPIFILGSALLIRFLFPKQDAVQVVASIFIPIAAFFWRAAMADRHFGQGRQLSGQILLFFLGIFFLVLLDAFFIICHMNPQPIGPEDWRALGSMYLIYLAIMAISLFPFRAGTTDNRVEVESEFDDF